MCNDDDDDYDRNETQCMLVDRYASQRYASQRFSSQNNSRIFPEPTILQMRLHARCKLLVSDNILSAHVRPRQRSDVRSIRLCLSPISSFAVSEQSRKYSTTGCILVKTQQGN